MRHHADKVLCEGFVVIQGRVDQHDGFYGLLIPIPRRRALQLNPEVLDGLYPKRPLMVVAF